MRPASPLARRLARIYGLSLLDLKGSGPGGRIVRLDVERHRRTHDEAAMPAPARDTEREVTPGNRDGLARSAPGLSHVVLRSTCDGGELEKVLDRLAAVGASVSVAALFTKASAMAFVETAPNGARFAILPVSPRGIGAALEPAAACERLGAVQTAIEAAFDITAPATPASVAAGTLIAVADLTGQNIDEARFIWSDPKIISLAFCAAVPDGSIGAISITLSAADLSQAVKMLSAIRSLLEHPMAMLA